MKKFNHVIVRRPCKAMVEGITSGLYPGKPDFELALKQHDTYIEALKQCDVDVTVLEADERYPDSCFVEDPALITRKCAIITNPGKIFLHGQLFDNQDIQNELMDYIERQLIFVDRTYAGNVEILPYAAVDGAVGASALAILRFFIRPAIGE